MAHVIYNSFKHKVVTGTVDLNTDTFKAMLVTSSYVPNIDTHDFRDDVTNEVAGTGYTAGGATLANVVVTQDNTNDRVTFASDNLSWATATITARAMVIYKARGGAASADELVAYIDFGSDYSSTAAAFTVTCPAAGWINNS